jgi:hypothetical protein
LSVIEGGSKSEIPSVEALTNSNSNIGLNLPYLINTFEEIGWFDPFEKRKDG